LSGRTSRVKGHNYERKNAQRFREAGYTYCKTSRAASRLLDDCGVDLAYVPFNVQCKNVKSSINYFGEISNMKTKLKENLPPTDAQHTYPFLVLHKRQGKGELAVMEADGLFNLLTRIQELESSDESDDDS
jgi:hypothetical protein